MLKKKILFSFLSALFSFSFLTSSAFAGAPDGSGPWADSVVSAAQGLRKDGSSVVVTRSDGNSALGVAENTNSEGSFYSLGFGGVLTLGFNNGISSGVLVVEATNLPYPTEKAKVEVSSDGITYVNAGSVSQDGSVNVPQNVSCAKYVRITDISNKDDFSDDTADGYDVDGVKAEGESCTPVTPTPTPGGGACGCSSTSVTQVNNVNVGVNVNSKANTGNNKASKNTIGNTNLTTGNATSNVAVVTTGGTNTANVDSCCCEGGVNVNISGNGAGSKNEVNINTKADKKSKKNK